MKLSRIEPMQTHEPDEGKEEEIAVADIREKSQSVAGIEEGQAESDKPGDVLSEETKGGLLRLADFLRAKNKKEQQTKKSPSLHLTAIKAYKALDKFELEEAQKATQIKKSA